ncbi:right-handed parallel beta-helix repeat-containing protein [Polaribacter staleyi]|uniref:right-handed parallel beta-helix repeat-containing protein n=1 Tax=Polaribacter staleyi TaxID=2022337 RepID=UPI0031BB081C
MRKAQITIFLFLFVIIQISSQIVNVADHGIKPGKDVTLEVYQLLNSLEGKKNVTLFFPKGQYEFYPENAFEEYRAVTNHDNSLKKIAFPIYNFENFTLDGNGSTFMFHGKISPIVVEGSTNTRLKNFAIDWDKSFVNELKVVKNNEEENSFVVEVANEKFGFEVKNNQILFNHYDWQDEIGQNIAFDSATKSPIWQTKNYFLKPQPKTAAKIIKIDNKTAKFINYTKVTPPVGTVFATYGKSPGLNRHVPAIHLSNSKDNFLNDVTVLQTGGMGLIAERCENISLDKFIVTSRVGRTIATRADATHFLGCKGSITLENCLFEHMLDDGINVHGAYVKVEKYVGNNTFLCETSHPQQWGFTFGEKGDEIMIISRETILPIFKTEITEVKVLNERRTLITVAELPTVMPEGKLSLENLTWYPDVYMNKNIIRENRARSALITTKGKVLVENNYFSSQMHGILIEGDNNKWYESGGVQDITIRNNTFENIGYGSGDSYPLLASPLFTSEQKFGNQKFHQNINFINNVIKSFNGQLVHAMSVKGLNVSGNSIEISTDYPTGAKLPAIDLEYCEDVIIEKNQFKKFDFPIKATVKDNNSKVKIKKNKGLLK